jgi:hypothetical protein
MTPTRNELLVALGSLKIHALHSAEHEAIEALASHLESKGVAELVSPDGSDLLKAFLTGLSRVATKGDANLLLAAQQIAVVSVDLCNACAVKDGEDAVVFVFQGLLKAILFFLEFAHMVHELDASVKAGTAPQGIDHADMEILVSEAYASLYHYMGSAEPLIRPGEQIPAQEKASLMIRFSRVLWFLLMHEIGHIQLGHFGEGTLSSATSTAPALICAENLNLSKLQEFEADLYVCNTLKDSEQYALLSYVMAPLDMFASFERNLMPSGDSHPMAVNRLQNILATRRPYLDELSITTTEEMIARNHLAIDPIRLLRQNYAPRTTKAQAVASMNELQQLFARLPQPASATDEEIDRARLWDYTVGYFWKVRFRAA